MADYLTDRAALAKAYCQHRDCCDEGCHAGLRFADALIASGAVVDAATLVDDEALVRRINYGDNEYPRLFPGSGRDEITAVLRTLAAALADRGGAE